MQELVVVVMGQDCENFIEMSLESVKDADKIIYIDGGSKPDFWKKFDRICWRLDIRPDILRYHYDQEDKQMNGKQRNRYLDFVKLNYPDSWCLALDADEVVSDLYNLKRFIQTAKNGVYSVKMRHFIGNIGQEDNKVPTHLALNRLFKISETENYPLVEHPVLEPKKDTYIFWTDCVTLWHLGYIHGMFDIKRKYQSHLAKSNMHTKDELYIWYMDHLFGRYPTKGMYYAEIPDVILKNFLVDSEELYFHTHKQLEVRHFIMVKEWIDYFNPKKTLDLACGLGLYGSVFKYLNKEWEGLELSEFAIKHSLHKIKQGDIKDKHDYKDYDLVLVLDVLEHLKYEELDDTLNTIKNYGKNFIFSLPYIGDPNLHLDKTHRIFETRAWWIEQLSKYFKIKDAPKDWAFNHQLLIGETNGVV